MTTKEIRELSIEAIQESIADYERTLKDLRYSHTVQPIENPNRIGMLRRDIARLHTIMNQKYQAQSEV